MQRPNQTGLCVGVQTSYQALQPKPSPNLEVFDEC